MSETIWHTAGSAGRELGVSRQTIFRACVANPGFGVRVINEFRIPDAHVRRVLAGETPADIAKSVRANAGSTRAA